MLIAVNMAVGPTIRLQSGAWLDLLDPWSSDFTIEDIAHGLSLTCRYAGQCRDFYSVAEHSMLVSQAAPEFAFEALLHDATEAFLGDVTRPLKQLLPAYKEIEKEFERAIFQRFGLPESLPKEVKQADLQVLAAEQSQIMPAGTDGWALEAGVAHANVKVRHLAPAKAKREFLSQFYRLSRARSARCSLGQVLESVATLRTA